MTRMPIAAGRFDMVLRRIRHSARRVSLPCYNARMIRDEKHTISNDGDTPRVKRGKARSFAWVLVLAIGVALIALGIAQGDMLDTWRKASLICYECIGIG